MEDEGLSEKAQKQHMFFRKRMIRLLDLFYRKRKVPFEQQLHLRPKGIYGAFRLENQGAGILKERKQKEKLERYQQEIADFTKFLKEIFPEFFYNRLEI